MKKKLLVLAITAMTLPCFAQAETGWYIIHLKVCLSHFHWLHVAMTAANALWYV